MKEEKFQDENCNCEPCDCGDNCKCENSNDTNENDKVLELVNDIKRLQAEFENYRKRTEKEKAEYSNLATKMLIRKFLPVLDNFSLALKNTENQKQFVEGMELVFAQFNDILRENNVEKVQTKAFDPNLHEAIMSAEGEKDTILEVFQDGYSYKGEILRPARVKVGKGN